MANSSSTSKDGSQPHTPSSEAPSVLDTLGHKRKRAEPDNWESGDWGDYMKIKHRKLNEQFRDMAAPKVSTIFEGVSIYVNGWTQPNADELKEMIHSHGGHYEFNLYSNVKVTHTIASNLPNAKIKNLGRSIVCTPAWIVDSIAAGRQLPVDKYLLYREESGQKKLGFEKMADRETSQEHSSTNGDSALEATTLDHVSDKRRSGTKAYHPANGAQFVSEFFTNSRLHYLSTWSNELKLFTAKMLKQVSPRQPKLPSKESLRSRKQRAVVHIDLDCFFVSVSIRDKPNLKGKAIAVTHAKLPKNTDPSDPIPKHVLDSTSDIASCSYAARDAGIHNGMSVGKAMKLCPELILMPYDFEAYRQVSQCLYETLLQYSSCVEAVSCDEAYIEFTDYVSDCKQVEDIVLELRREIESKVCCTVSAGIAHNMLLARMCTRVAKPDGQFYLPMSDTKTFLESQNVNHLPGVGYSTTHKLKDMNIETCSQLAALSLDKLRDIFGQKTGKLLHDFARGLDNRELKTETERKSVSVDINYGIRFKEIGEAESLIENLSKELEKRACEAEVLGGTVALKMKIRQASAPKETWKHLGHGACDNVTRSFTLLQPTRTAAELARLAVRLLRQIRPVASDIRGMGLQLSKLVSAASKESRGAALGMNLKKFIKPETRAEEAKPEVHFSTPAQVAQSTIPPKSTIKGANFFGAATTSSAPVPKESKHCNIDIPPLSQLDNSVLDALPDYLRDEILQGYVDKEVNNIAATTAKPKEGGPRQDGGLLTKDYVSKREVLQEKAVKSAAEDKESSPLLIIENEGVFLKDMRAHVKAWIMHFIEGPPERDVQTLTDYLLKLLAAHLDLVTQTLQTMRRLIARLELCLWFPVFNSILDRVQHNVKTQYKGHLQIHFL